MATSEILSKNLHNCDSNKGQLGPEASLLPYVPCCPSEFNFSSHNFHLNDNLKTCQNVIWCFWPCRGVTDLWMHDIKLKNLPGDLLGAMSQLENFKMTCASTVSCGIKYSCSTRYTCPADMRKEKLWMKNNFFANNSLLKTVTVQNSFEVELEPELISQLHQLEELNLSENNLTIVPQIRTKVKFITRVFN